jgi:hypothetical protein
MTDTMTAIAEEHIEFVKEHNMAWQTLHDAPLPVVKWEGEGAIFGGTWSHDGQLSPMQLARAVEYWQWYHNARVEGMK